MANFKDLAVSGNSCTPMESEVLSNSTVESGKQCPRCGSTNTNCQNGIWYCFDCRKEF